MIEEKILPEPPRLIGVYIKLTPRGRGNIHRLAQNWGMTDGEAFEVLGALANLVDKKNTRAQVYLFRLLVRNLHEFDLTEIRKIIPTLRRPRGRPRNHPEIPKPK